MIRTTWFVMAVGTIGAASFAGQDQGAKPYNLVEIGTLGGQHTRIAAVNSRKVAVGASQVANGGWRAMLWADGNTFDLPLPNPPGSSGEATSINESGAISANLRVDARHEVSYLVVGDRVSELGSLGGTETHASHLNNRGQVVGWSTTKDGIRRAFLWSGGSMKDLGTLSTMPTVSASGKSGKTVSSSPGSVSANESKSIDIREGGVRITGSVGGSASGQASGRATGSASGTASGSGNAAADPRFRQSMAYGINDRGEVVGSAQNPAGQWRAVVWKSGGIVDIGPAVGTPGGSSESGTGTSTSSKPGDSKIAVERGSGSIRVAGQASGSGSSSGSVRSSGSSSDASAPAPGSAAVSINENSEIVGWYEVESEKGRRVNRAFHWSQGKWTDIGGDQVSSAQALSINERGAIVGRATSSNGMPFAFLYSGGTMIDLNDHVVESASVRRGMFEALDVTDSGAVAVNILNPDGRTRGALLVRF